MKGGRELVTPNWRVKAMAGYESDQTNVLGMEGLIDHKLSNTAQERKEGRCVDLTSGTY